MNKRVSAILTALVLALALSACGSGRQDGGAGTGTTDPPRQEDSTSEGNDDSGGTVVPGRDPAVTDDTGDSAAEDLERMVRSARVHDRDGDLLDGENTTAPGADRW